MPRKIRIKLIDFIMLQISIAFLFAIGLSPIFLMFLKSCFFLRIFLSYILF